MNFEKDILNKLFQDENITDISFNGKDIFVQHNKRGRYKISDGFDPNQIENYVKQLTYQNNQQFNDEQPILDTEFPNLRINAVHKTIAPYGMTVSLRSSVASLKINKYDKSIAPMSIFSLLEACVKANCNIIISGKTGSGKTEMQKYLVGFIPDNDKIVLIEDTLDTHLKEIYPDKDILSWKINTKLEKPIMFDELIKAGLRNNPDWIIISETRGSEAYSMLKSCLSGHHIITTIHSNNAKSNVERIIHMCKEKYQLDQKLLGSMICDNFNLGIHLDHIVDEFGVKRFISEVVEYISYDSDGTIINPLFTRITTINKKNGRFMYNVNYKYGKMSEKLFQRLASYKVLNTETDRFIKEEYYAEKN
jgi:pilus assembly protein CpaF